MRSMLFACAAVLLFGGSSASAAYNFLTGECSNCQPSRYGHGGHVFRRPVMNPAPGAYRHAGYGFEEGYCVDEYGRRMRGHHLGGHHLGGGIHGMGGGMHGGGMGGGPGAHPWQDGPPSGPPTAHVGYPYYTLRGPRDFLINNPPSIGP